MSSPSSFAEKACVGWAERYFNDCLRNLKDEISFSFGLVSLLCWGIAEIPQIITNFRTKSSHGVSLAFLFAWIAGDVFNLAGCVLEPATLPTQLYTALLYTSTTVLLVLQCLYYDHIWRWLKRRPVLHRQVDEMREPTDPKPTRSGVPIPSSGLKILPQEYYYTSARSLASSNTPPFRSYLSAAKSGPPTLMTPNDDSSDDDALPLLRTQPTQPRQIPISRSAGYAAFLASSVTFPLPSKGLMEGRVGERAAYGQWLGWLMAAVYMGGRVPQIYLNVKRGSVEGLNPLMFVFALLANVTYVGSIVVRTVEWQKIKANMPWLLDAVVCVLLDLFILLQYVYYKRMWRIGHPKDRDDHRNGFKEANKSVDP